jgi:tetratricopeptide (TPR) repeat protein
MILQTYQALGKPPEMLATAKDLLAMNANNIQALYWIATLVPALELKDAADLELGARAGNGLLAGQKPADTKDEEWVKAKKEFDALGHKDLGYVAMARENSDLAEREFRKCLEIAPEQAQVSSWLGLAIYRQKKPERQSEVLYHFARAAMLDPDHGGIPNPQSLKTVQEYLERAYRGFHGEDPQGLAELKAEAAKSPFPPAGFKVENINEIAIRKEEESKQTNPQLALWMGIKKELTTASGAEYFESSLKNAAVPKLKGTLISARPATNSKELVVGIEKPGVAEAVLKLAAPVKGRPRPGCVIEWDGVPTAFSKDPFLLTFTVENNKKIAGLEIEATPRAAPARKDGARKK